MFTFKHFQHIFQLMMLLSGTSLLAVFKPSQPAVQPYAREPPPPRAPKRTQYTSSAPMRKGAVADRNVRWDLA